MKKFLGVLVLLNLMIMSGPLFAQDSMDQKRKNTADKIVNKMVDEGASSADIKQQQKTNKETLGHEGEVK